jgi:hypothetical protein
VLFALQSPAAVPTQSRDQAVCRDASNAHHRCQVDFAVQLIFSGNFTCMFDRYELRRGCLSAFFALPKSFEPEQLPRVKTKSETC